MKKIIAFILCAVMALSLVGCAELDTTPSYDSKQDVQTQMNIADDLVGNQPTPHDINYSLERYNLIRRTYWVNGQREKANALPCAVEKPLGYILLFTESGSIVGNFIVDGKVSSLNSYLTPDSEYYELGYGGSYREYNKWLADVDGSYGENDNGIFFFTPDGKYIEWTGIYLYSDIPFEVQSTLLTIGGDSNE